MERGDYYLIVRRANLDRIHFACLEGIVHSKEYDAEGDEIGEDSWFPGDEKQNAGAIPKMDYIPIYEERRLSIKFHINPLLIKPSKYHQREENPRGVIEFRKDQVKAILSEHGRPIWPKFVSKEDFLLSRAFSSWHRW